MDQELLKELAHLKMLLKKQNGTSVDLGKLLSDKTYAAEVLGVAEETDNPPLVMLAIDLKARLGLIPDAPTNAPAAAAPAPEDPDKPPQKKYVFGTRG
jgi:hypothetical protein